MKNRMRIFTAIFAGLLSFFIFTNCKVTVEDVILTSINITRFPDKTQYFIGEELDLTGLEVQGKYNDGKKKPVVDYGVIGFDSAYEHENLELTVSIKTKKALITAPEKIIVSVHKVEVDSIIIKSLPYKTEYFVGDEFDGEGLEVWEHYNNGSERLIENWTIEGFDSSVPAQEQVLTVVYQLDEEQVFTASEKILVKINAIEPLTITASGELNKTQYFVGEEFDTSGITVTAEYNNGTSGILEGWTVEGFDSSVPVEEQELTIVYEYSEDVKLIADYKPVVKIIPVVSTSIEIAGELLKSDYFVGESLVTDGISVIAHYNNGSSQFVENWTVSGFDSENPASEQELTVSYISETGEILVAEETLKVNIIAIVATSIEVTGDLSKTEYFVGEALETSGITVTATYNNGTVAEVSGWKVEGFDSENEASLELTVSYISENGIKLTAERKLNVRINAIVAISIEVTGDLSKTEYFVGEALETSGISVTAIYNNGTTATVDDWFVSGFDSNSAAENQELTVNYISETGELLVSERKLSVNIIAIVATSIQASGDLSKTKYFVGDTLDSTGITVTATYNNGTTAEVSGWTIGGFDSTSPAETLELSIIYVTPELNVLTADKKYTVTIIPIVAESISVTGTLSKTEYFVGETLETSGITVTATYNNGTSAEVTGWAIEGFDSSAAGALELDVTYNAEDGTKLTANETLLVNINPVLATEIEVSGDLTKTDYFVGDILDNSGIKVTVLYNNGTTSETDNWSITGFDSSEPAEALELNVVYVTPELVTLTAERKLTVKIDAVVATLITVSGDLSKTEYFVGETLETSGITVTASYNNGTTAEITGWTISGFDSTEPAENQTLTVNYVNENGETLTAVQTLTVNINAIVATSITVEGDLTKTQYYVGDTLDPTGITVTATYNNGTTAEVDGWIIGGFDSSEPAEALELSVIYVTPELVTLTAERKLSVRIDAVVATSITANGELSKTEYFVGEELETSGITVTASYNNGTSAEISGWTISGFDSTTAAENQILSVNYVNENGETLTATQTLTVNINPIVATSITVTGDLSKTEYFVGEELETSGIAVTATYNNGTSAIVSGWLVSGFDSSIAAENQTLTVNYVNENGDLLTAEQTFSVNINAILPVSIEINGNLSKTNYFVGELLDQSGITVTATYNNGTSAQVENWTITGFDSSEPAEALELSVIYVTPQLVTLTAERKLTVAINPIVAVSIAVIGNLDKTDYYVGDSLESSGIAVTATYNNGSNAEVDGWTIEGFSSENPAAAQELTVVYIAENGVRLVAEQKLTVNISPVVATSIAVTGDLEKKQYFVGEELSTNGITVTATYNNGSSAVVEGWTVVGFNSETPAEALELTVSYVNENGTALIAEQKFNVEIRAIVATSITISGELSKKEYFVGDTLDSSGITITATYNNGTNAVVEGWTVVGFNSETPAEALELTVNYVNENDITLTAEQKLLVKINPVLVTGIQIAEYPVKRSYFVGDELDVTDLKVTANYNNGTSGEVNGWIVEGFDSVNPHETLELHVSYQGFTAEETFTVTVVPVYAVEIVASGELSKTHYYVGDELDSNGITVTATYNNGTSSVVNGWELTGFDSDNPADNLTIKVKYTSENGSDLYANQTYLISIEPVVAASITVSGELSKTQYYVGDELELDGITVTATYNNGTSSVVSGWNVVGFDSDTPSIQNLSVTYVAEDGETLVAAQELTVKVDAVVAVSIAVSGELSKTQYYVGDTLETSGITVTATYNNGTSAVVDGWTVEGFSSIIPNEAINLTVAYISENGTKLIASEKPVVSVAAVVAQSIEITTMPDKLSYFVGDDFESDGLVVTANYNNGTSETVTGWHVTGFVSSQAGTIQLNVTYVNEEDNVLTADETISVTINAIVLESISIETMPEKTEYFVGESLSTTGMTVKGHYNNGDEIAIQAWNVIGFDSSAPAAAQKLTVVYEFDEDTVLEAEEKITVVIKAIELIQIEIETLPSKLTYHINDETELITDGLKVIASRNNNTSDDVTESCILTGFDSSVKGDQTITVSYTENGIEKTATFEINVYALITSIEIIEPASSVNCIVGDSLADVQVRVNAIYEDDDIQEVTGFTVEGLSSDTVGFGQTVTVTYSENEVEKTCDFELNVKYKFHSEVTVLPAGTDGTAGPSATYVLFGDFPQDKMAVDVTVADDAETVVVGNNVYYLGSDGYYYALNVVSSTAKYYKVDAMKWRVLQENYRGSGKKLLFPERVYLSGSEYMKFTSNSKIRTIDEERVYLNNYKHSKVRAYLNGLSYVDEDNTQINTYLNNGFLQNAFTEEAIARINTTTVFNGATSDIVVNNTTGEKYEVTTNPEYICEDTYDKLFLLSIDEVANSQIFGEVDTRGYKQRFRTDYAWEVLKCNNNENYGGATWYWLRTPCKVSAYKVYGVNSSGIVDDLEHGTSNSSVGIMPAITISF